MEQSPWEAERFSASQKIWWNPKVHYNTHRCSSPFSLYHFHSLFWAYHSWGIKQGLVIVTCKTENSLVIGLVCVFLEVFLTALYFRVTYCPHLQSLYSIHASALCFWVPLWGTWEHKALAWVGYKLWGWGNNLTFFQFGENTQWIMDGFAMGRMCARHVDIDHFCAKAPWV